MEAPRPGGQAVRGRAGRGLTSCQRPGPQHPLMPGREASVETQRVELVTTCRCGGWGARGQGSSEPPTPPLALWPLLSYFLLQRPGHLASGPCPWVPRSQDMWQVARPLSLPLPLIEPRPSRVKGKGQTTVRALHLGRHSHQSQPSAVPAPSCPRQPPSLPCPLPLAPRPLPGSPPGSLTRKQRPTVLREG